MIIFESDVAKKILSEYGCSNIESYTLVNNSGVYVFGYVTISFLILHPLSCILLNIS